MPGIPTKLADATESSRSVKLSSPSFTDAKRSETPEAEMPTVPGTTDLWSALNEPPTPTNKEAPVISTSSAVCGPERPVETDCFDTCALPAALTKPAIETPAVNATSSAVVCVAVSGTLKERPRTLKSIEATLVDVDC